jgi:pimeloyl-ACP methyl ester carboxylesterase
MPRLPSVSWLNALALGLPLWGIPGIAGSAAPPATALTPPVTAESLRARYAQPPSRFVTVDGVALHLRDEGRGPPVVLLPGHLGNLHMFDPWMPTLLRHHRVIRIDWPPYGLSLPDPAGAYSTYRAVTLVIGLLDALHIPRFALVGTSNGATVAAHLAAQYPTRVTRLAVSTLPLGVPAPRESSPALLAVLKLYGHDNQYRPPEFFRAVLENIFADPAHVTDALVTLYTDENNQPGGYDAVDEYVRTNVAMYARGTLLAEYRPIRVPVLVQWGDAGKVLPAAAALEAVDAFPSAPVVLKRYARSGHMPMLEEPEETAADLSAFLEGRLDAEARAPRRP